MPENPKQSNEILYVIYGVSASIGLQFNPNKRKSLSFCKGKHDKVKFKLRSETNPALEKEENEIYLGIALLI